MENEYVDAMLKAGWSGVVCKVDMKKAYDHVNWGYVDWVLNQMGFSERWRHWMNICMSTPSYSILVNGSPKGFFRRSRGLRQGDPLSPYLFIIVVDILDRLMAIAESVGLVEDFSPNGVGPKIPFIQFADDSLFMLKAEDEGMKNLRCILLII